jgi:hypothetical protein
MNVFILIVVRESEKCNTILIDNAGNWQNSNASNIRLTAALRFNEEKLPVIYLYRELF